MKIFRFCASLKKLKNMDFFVCKLKKAQKTWIQLFPNLKKLKKHEFNFCKLKNSKNMTLIFFQA